MLLIGLPRHNVALGSDNLRRAIPSGSDRLGFVKFNRLPVIDIVTEGGFDGVDIALECIGRNLDAVGKELENRRDLATSGPSDEAQRKMFINPSARAPMAGVPPSAAWSPATCLAADE